MEGDSQDEIPVQAAGRAFCETDIAMGLWKRGRKDEWMDGISRSHLGKMYLARWFLSLVLTIPSVAWRGWKETGTGADL